MNIEPVRTPAQNQNRRFFAILAAVCVVGMVAAVSVVFYFTRVTTPAPNPAPSPTPSPTATAPSVTIPPVTVTPTPLPTVTPTPSVTPTPTPTPVVAPWAGPTAPIANPINDPQTRFAYLQTVVKIGGEYYVVLDPATFEKCSGCENDYRIINKSAITVRYKIQHPLYLFGSIQLAGQVNPTPVKFQHLLDMIAAQKGLELPVWYVRDPNTGGVVFIQEQYLP